VQIGSKGTSLPDTIASGQALLRYAQCSNRFASPLPDTIASGEALLL